MISEPYFLLSSSQKQVRAGRLQFGAIYARHTQTVNLYAPLTLRFGLTHGRPCPQVWSGRRLASPRCRSCLPIAVRMRLGRSRSGPAWTCIEDLRVRTGSVAARRADAPSLPPTVSHARPRNKVNDLNSRSGVLTALWLDSEGADWCVGKLDTLPFQRCACQRKQRKSRLRVFER